MKPAPRLPPPRPSGPVEAAVHARRPAVFDGSVHGPRRRGGTDLRPGNTTRQRPSSRNPTTIVLPPGATAVVTPPATT
ncbi:hypothetical protein HBB16_17635 [Pseudonocardia sp. MCCB 268]|nr:hypothetical protein [Pseudonocardia cytotoxica]